MAEEIVTGILVKTSKETPLQGKIINTIDTPYPEENAYSVNMIRKMLVPPFNLLVNPDFQCNQRGQIEYITSTIRSAYGLDMWVSYNATITKLVNGIKFKRTETTDIGIIAQSFDFMFWEDKSYTLLCKVDGINHKFIAKGIKNDGVFLTKTFDNITLHIRNKPNHLGEINLSVNNNDDVLVEYIDLFEGEIAYPHVKEDYAIALLRCQKYLKVLRYKFVLGTVNVINNTTAYCSINHSLINIPTIKFGNGIIVTQRAGNTTITSIIIDQGITDKYNLFLYLRTNEGNSFAQDDSGFCYCNATDGYLELTCEPQ